MSDFNGIAQLYRGTAAALAAEIPAIGRNGYITDTGQMFVGDGSTTVASLPKFIAADTQTKIIATSNNGQSIANAPASPYQTIIWEDEELDKLGEYNPATGEFTVTYTGHYLITAQMMFAGVSWTAAEKGLLILAKDGALYTELDRHEVDATVTKFMSLGGGTLVNATAGEVYTVNLFQNSGAALALYNQTVNNRLTISRIL